MKTTLLTALVFSLASVATAQTHKTYRIGNSLTWDSQPVAIGALAKQRGIEHTQAYHIKCGSSLQSIWDHPDETCVKPVKPYGTFRGALADHAWDTVAIQPHRGKGSTLATDTARIVDFIELARSKGKNTETVFYIYAAWPGQEEGKSYREVWERKVDDADDTPTVQCAAYFDLLLARVRKAMGDKTEVRMIRAGAVLAELDRMAEAGEVPGYASAKHLYRDRVHLNHVGRFIAGTTVFTTLFDQDATGLRCPPKQYGGGKDFNDPLYAAITNAVNAVRRGDRESR